MSKRPNLKFAYTKGFPCKDCENRSAECHATCEKYRVAKADAEEKREKYREQLQLEIQYAKFVKEKGRRLGKGMKY